MTPGRSSITVQFDVTIFHPMYLMLQIPRLLHGAVARVVELQLHGRPARDHDEVRARPPEPQGVLPRGAPPLALPQLRQFGGGGRRLQRGRQRGHVCLRRG